MAKYPSLPLFTDAYLSDTRHLTTLQHGAYLLMIMTAWRRPDCMLPLDDSFLSKICGMDKRTWASNRDVLLSFWHEENGQIYQKRLRDELQFCNARRESNSRAGKASALKNKERHSTSVKQVCNTNSTNPHPQPTPTKKVRVESDKSLSVCARDFETFWKTYPQNNGSKKLAGEKYGIAIKSGITSEQLIAGARAYSEHVAREGTERRFIAHAATWLHQRRWEIEYTAEKPSPAKPSIAKPTWASAGAELIAKYEREAELERGRQVESGENNINLIANS